MTTGAQSVRGAAPANLKEWLIVARHAGATIGRAMAIVIAIIILAFVIGDSSIYFQAIGTIVGTGCLYLALGAGARPLVIYFVGFVLFAQLRAHADELGTPVQYSYPIQAEKLIFLGVLPTLRLQDAFYSYSRLGILEAYTIGIYISYFFIPHAFALGLWRWDRNRFRVYVPAFLLTLYIGLIFCAIVPTAPPWLASESGKIPTVYQILPDILKNVAPGTYQQGENAAGTNAVAAMPSLHAAIPWMMVIACWNYRWWFRLPALGYAASMSFTIVYLGEHYFVDALAGLGAAAVAWLAASRVVAWWESRGATSGAKAGDLAERVGRRDFASTEGL